jgi:hypothetical protein
MRDWFAGGRTSWSGATSTAGPRVIGGVHDSDPEDDPFCDDEPGGDDDDDDDEGE